MKKEEYAAYPEPDIYGLEREILLQFDETFFVINLYSHGNMRYRFFISSKGCSAQVEGENGKRRWTASTPGNLVKKSGHFKETDFICSEKEYRHALDILGMEAPDPQVCAKIFSVEELTDLVDEETFSLLVLIQGVNDLKSQKKKAYLEQTAGKQAEELIEAVPMQEGVYKELRAATKEVPANGIINTEHGMYSVCPKCGTLVPMRTLVAFCNGCGTKLYKVKYPQKGMHYCEWPFLNVRVSDNRMVIARQKAGYAFENEVFVPAVWDVDAFISVDMLKQEYRSFEQAEGKAWEEVNTTDLAEKFSYVTVQNRDNNIGSCTAFPMLKKSAALLDRDPVYWVKWLMLYMQSPGLRDMNKRGAFTYIEEMSYTEQKSTSGKTLAQIWGIQKAEQANLLRWDVSHPQLEFYKTAKVLGFKFGNNDAKETENLSARLCASIVPIAFEFELNPIKIFTYLNKFEEPVKQVVRYYEYLVMARDLRYDIKDKSRAYPKVDEFDLHYQDAYVRTKDIRDLREREEEDRKIKAFAEKITPVFSFEDEKFFIRPIASYQELQDEGENMGNCIFRCYHTTYAEGRTNLLVLRKKNDPDHHYIDIEVNGGFVKQAYIAGNKEITDTETESFLQEFCREKRIER